MDARARQLAGTAWFNRLSDDALESLARRCDVYAFAPGDVVFGEGVHGDRCYVIVAGAVRVSRAYPHGLVVDLAELGPGEVFGELALFGDERRSATVEAVEPTETLALAHADLRPVLAADPEALLAMLEGLARRLRTANERVMVQAFDTVAGRVAATLLARAAVERSDSPEGYVVGGSADTARLAGAPRKGVRRFLDALEGEGVIELRSGGMVVRDTTALRAYLS
jgi:CRP-like cAMP-binding protein